LATIENSNTKRSANLFIVLLRKLGI
jgi:hypothetical protein